MPPKLTKKEQEELARQEEERRKQEEEERLRIEAEERKKLEVKELSTGLICRITEYYVTECLKSKNPGEFTTQFVEQSLKKSNIFDNFRPIDIRLIVQYHLHNLNFACENLFNQNEIYIFANMMWQVLSNSDPKYTLFRAKKEGEDQQQYEKERKRKMFQLDNKKTDSDTQLFLRLLKKHSIENKEEKAIKSFSSQSLQLILAYMKQAYLMYFNLYKFVGSNDQQEQDQYQTIFIDAPQTISEKLEQAIYHPLDGYDANKQQEEEANNQKKAEQDQLGSKRDEDESKPEEEEPLDPISQQILEEKIKEMQEEIQQKLTLRKQQQEQKLLELQATKGKKK